MNKKRGLAAYPYLLWSLLFIVVPLIIVLFFSFTKKIDSQYVFSLENYQKLISPQYLKVFGRSLLLAIISTVACLVMGYPIAYMISKMHVGKRNVLIMLFILPMWMNFLLRTYSWLAILGKNGIINT